MEAENAMALSVARPGAVSPGFVVREKAIVLKKGGGTQLSAKPVTELVKAAEAVHAMTYRALGDGTEAGKGGGGDSDEIIKKLSVTIMKGLNRLVEKTPTTKPADVVTDV